MNPYTPKILAALENVERTPSGFKACCPIHRSAERKLTLYERPNGEIVIRCCDGCDASTVLRTLGLASQIPTTSDDIVAPAEWPAARQLPPERPPVPKFDCKLLPKPFVEWVQDIAERMHCPVDFVAVAVMVAASAVIGRKVVIRPKEFDDWEVTPNLWGAIIGRPSVCKTPALKEAYKPLKRLEAKAKQEFLEKQKTWNETAMLRELEKRQLKKQLEAAFSEGNEEEARRLSARLEELNKDGVTRKRYTVNDTSVEKLGELLKENPNGLLVFRDELVGFLKSLDKDGQECARAFYLEAWSGNGSFTYDRIGRGTIEIENTILSVLGGMQPGVLEGYVSASINGGALDDGLIQRVQLVVWPDPLGNFRNVDRRPRRAPREAAYAAFEHLDKLEASTAGATQDESSAPYLRFDKAAQVTFNAWREDLENRIGSGVECEALESHLAKYRSMVPSLALILHLAERGVGPVSSESLNKAIQWADYLEAHARRVYAIAIDPAHYAARQLLKKLAGGELKDGFSARDVLRHGWKGLSRPSDVEDALRVLTEHGWLQIADIRTGGRPTQLYWIYPRKQVDKTAKSPDAGGSVSFDSDSEEAVSELDGWFAIDELNDVAGDVGEDPLGS